MKINDMGKHLIQNIMDQSAIRQANTQQTPKTAESGNPSATGSAQEAITRSYEVEKEFAPRTDLINTVSDRIAAGSYDRELASAVAGKVADSPSVRARMDEIAAANAPGEKSQSTNAVQSKVQGGYYRNNDILHSTAERIIGKIDIQAE